MGVYWARIYFISWRLLGWISPCPRCILTWSFWHKGCRVTQKGPCYPNPVWDLIYTYIHVYMLANTGLILVLIWYKGHMKVLELQIYNSQVGIVGDICTFNASKYFPFSSWTNIFKIYTKGFHNPPDSIRRVDSNSGHICVKLTDWDRVTHISIVKLTIIGSDNGLSPGQRQAIIWNKAGILLNGPLGRNFSEILIGIQTFSFKKKHLKMSSAKWRPFVSASKR